METVTYRDLPDADAADRYYERAGVLLCLAYVLNTSDCQYENVVAAGEQPVLLDGETVFHTAVGAANMLLPTPVADVVTRSVLLTFLLPYTVEGAGDATRPLYAGFGSESAEPAVSSRPRPEIEAVNTDVMRMGGQTPTFDTSDNTPSVDGEDCPPGRHLDSLHAGFVRAYETIRDLHEDGRFFGEIVDRDHLAGIETRLLYRSTDIYRWLLRSMAAPDPDSLTDGIWLSLLFERLVVPFFDGSIDVDGYWPLYAAERRALRRRDVPRFTTSPTGTTAYHDGEPLDVSLEASGYERSRQRVAAFDEADRTYQSWILRRSYTTDRDSPSLPDRDSPSSDQASPSRARDSSLPDAVDVSGERLRREAASLFDDAMAAIDDGRGDDWVLLSPTGSELNIVPSGESIYQGRTGVALAAAALAAVTERERYRDLVADLLDPVIDGIDAGRPSFPLGGTEGVGAVVYGLSVVADLLDEPRYRRRAADAAHTVTDDLIAAADDFDVTEGTAGTLLGLLAHYDRYGDADVLERAVACGDRLLEQRTTVDGSRVWRTSDGDALTGFSHGSAGAAYALARLAAATDDDRYRDAVREALAFEKEQYVPDRRNWQYGVRTETYVDRWCHGRSGITLARVGIARALGADALPRPPDAVLPAIAGADPAPLDDLCCGNLARTEALLVGARWADAEPTEALELAGRCLARREQEGRLSFEGRVERRANPTFYKGRSGAAYTLLRLRNPDRLPSVLLFE